jgi:transcription initiation factor TFIIF subunit beta
MYNINQARVTMIAGQQGANFIKGIEIKKPRPQDNKYQRLEEGALIQQILIAFGEYRWWSIKTLNERLKQPEAHLREVLQKVAVLVKSGDAANKWQLNANTQRLIDYDSSKAAFVEDKDDEDDEDEDDDDDDDEEMEDVDV